MGPFIREDDHLFSSLLDLANLRFAPTYPPENDGINEMRNLQARFAVFSENNSLAQSFAVLGLGGFWNTKLKTKWYEFLDSYLPVCGFSTSGVMVENVNGHKGIISALIENFARDPLHPVYFTVHDLKEDPLVRIDYKKPLVYMKSTYLVISLPTTPWDG